MDFETAIIILVLLSVFAILMGSTKSDKIFWFLFILACAVGVALEEKLEKIIPGGILNSVIGFMISFLLFYGLPALYLKLKKPQTWARIKTELLGKK